MPKPLRVDPIDLRISANHMDVHHAELAASHMAANGEIEAAQIGWVGASGAALLGKFAEWQETTLALTSEIASHGAAFQATADDYVSTDQMNAEGIDRTL